jgi:hypothetical protein
MLCSMNSRRSTTLPSTQLTPPPLLSRSHTILPPEIPVFTSYSSTYYDTIIALHPEIDIRSTHPKPYSFYSFSPHLLPPTLYDSRRTNARIPRAIYQKTALGKKNGRAKRSEQQRTFCFLYVFGNLPHSYIYLHLPRWPGVLGLALRAACFLFHSGLVLCLYAAYFILPYMRAAGGDERGPDEMRRDGRTRTQYEKS